MRRAPTGYSVTGPGLEKEYEADGPALSRALTAAAHSHADGTWYVRDLITDRIVAHAERDGRTVTCQRRP